MDFKSLLLILSISSSLLISSNAVPSYQIFKLPQFPPTSAPAKSPQAAHASAISLKTLVSGATKVAKESVNPEIVAFCAGTENPTLCADGISKLLTGPFDPIKAVEIEVDETLKQASLVAEKIVELQKNPSTEKKIVQALDVCHSQYGDMLDAIKEATELMQQQNVVDAYYKFNAVISFKAACDDAFLETPGVNHVPFEADEITLLDLGGNVLGMMNGIVSGYRM